MDVMQKFRTVAIRATWLIGILVVFTIVINLSWFDEDLHPDLARIVEPQPVSMQNNSFPLVYGFEADDDQDSLAAGLTIVQSLRDRFDQGEAATLSTAEINEILGNPAAGFDWSDVFPAISCSSRFELDCADRLIADIERADRIQPRIQTLLDRYDRILQMPRFEENQEFDAQTPIPPYGAVMNAARVWLALSYVNKPTEAFLADIDADIRFWKLMLRDGQSLISKMVALAGLRNDTTFLSTLIRSRPLNNDQLAQIASILEPLSDDERDIGETFLAEMRISLLSEKSFAVLMDGPSWINRLALQKNATINENYLGLFMPLRLRAAMSAEEFYRGHDQINLSNPVRLFPPPLYNLGGKLTLNWAGSNLAFQDYISRVHELDGRISLVLLQAEIADSPNRRAEDVVQASRYRNPFTREPMSYDRIEQTIGFDCISNSDDRCMLQIGTPTG